MGDLISRKALTDSTELAGKIYSFNLIPYIKVEDLLDFVDNMPTAYDKDEVVEQLEEIKSKNSFFGSDYLIDKAIEIVEKGGME